MFDLWRLGGTLVNEEAIARELRALIGYGATRERVATMPHLREYGVEGIQLAIGRINGDQELPGFAQGFTAEQVQAALNMLLAFDREARRRRYLAPRRREEAIRLLGLGRMTVETWRRPDGPEFELMLILAHMFGPEAEAHERLQALRALSARVTELLAEIDEHQRQIDRMATHLLTGKLSAQGLEDATRERMAQLRQVLAELDRLSQQARALNVVDDEADALRERARQLIEKFTEK
jgi:hypothetical protein